MKNKLPLEKIWNKLLDLFVPEKPEIKKVEETKKVEKDLDYTSYLVGWVSRDKFSRKLRLHCNLPLNFKMFKEYSRGIACLPIDHFPNLEYEDGAIRVNVIIKYEKEDGSTGMDSKE